MDRVGLTDSSLLEQLNRDWRAYLRLEACKERKALDHSLANTRTILQSLCQSGELPLLLAAEKLLLNQELSLYANSPEEHNSITAALSQIEEAEAALKIVRDSAAYQAATATYPAKRKENSLPMDSFREFLKSHSARLTNRLVGRLSEQEKELLRQRKANLSAIREMYAALQRDALSGQTTL
jgi:hypothetical protein